MIYVINFLWQLIIFIICDFFCYIVLFRPSFRGHNNYKYYRGRYGIIYSDYNGDTRFLKWYKGKYNALFKIQKQI